MSSSSSSRLIVDQRPGRADGGSDHHRVHARSSVVVVPSSSIRVMSSCGRARRSESIIALRKSRRGQAVSRKRHMTMASMTTSVAGACDDYVDAMTSTTTNAMVGDYGDGDMDGMNNPYHADTRRCRDAMHSASLIVDSVHSIDAEEDGIIKDDHVRNMKAHLERLCALITPVSDDDAISATVASNSILRARTTSGNNLGWDLADALRQIIIEGGDGKMFQRDETLRAVMVVNQLAASEPPPPTEGGGAYHHGEGMEMFDPMHHRTQHAPTLQQPPPSSWCHALSGLCALDALPRLLSPPQHEPPHDEIHRQNAIMSDKVACAIGNLAGDSITNREMLLMGNAHHILSMCVSTWTGFARDRSRHVHPSYEADVLRSAIWGMTNVIKGGEVSASTTDTASMMTTAAAFVYVHDDGAIRGGTMDRLLTPMDARFLLLGPPRDIGPSVAPPPPPRPPLTTSWDDVATETCWLLSYLTRDPSVVECLCSSEHDCDGNVISALVGRLSHAADAACRRVAAASGGNNVDENDANREIGCLVPICRTLRNVAYSDDDGRYGNSILSSGGVGGGTTMTTAEGSATSSLARLVLLGTLGAGSEVNMIASEAASTSGACLYAAGLHSPPKRPTSAAREALIPALCRAFVSEFTTFDFRREVAWAIWSAVTFNPIEMDDVAYDLRTGSLVDIVRSAPRDMANALTTMLATSDADAMEVSLSLINAILRRLENVDGGRIGGSRDIPTLFEEVGLVDELWRVCDADTEEGYNAEMAAAILDDFYDRDDEDDGDNYADASLRPSSSGGQFQFQIPDMGIPLGGFDFGGSATVGNQLPPGGRGRGRVLPSWMALNN